MQAHSAAASGSTKGARSASDRAVLTAANASSRRPIRASARPWPNAIAAISSGTPAWWADALSAAKASSASVRRSTRIIVKAKLWTEPQAPGSTTAPPGPDEWPERSQGAAASTAAIPAGSPACTAISPQAALASVCSSRSWEPARSHARGAVVVAGHHQRAAEHPERLRLRAPKEGGPVQQLQVGGHGPLQLTGRDQRLGLGQQQTGASLVTGHGHRVVETCHGCS